MIKNLKGVLEDVALAKIQIEIDTNVQALLNLGESHYNFAKTIDNTEWRQKISRLYYAAYNVRRAVSLRHDGSFSTDTSDHANVEKVPDDFEDYAIYRSKLKNLRDDRNLADYSHLAKDSDLLINVVDAEVLVGNYIQHAKNFLSQLGMKL